MPQRRDLPDIETALVPWLEDGAALNALVAGRISSPDLPAGFTAEARVRFFRAGGTPVDSDTSRLDRALLQIDTYGADPIEAFTVAKKTIARLEEAAGETIGDGQDIVVTKVQRVNGPLWRPDPDTDVPGYLSQVVIFSHAVAG